MKIRKLALAAIITLLPWATNAAEILTLQQCRDSAVANNKSLQAARQETVVAGYDRKIALANYFPDVSVSGAYMYNSRNLNLLPKEASDALSGIGSSMQTSVQNSIAGLLSDPVIGQIIMNNPELMNFVKGLADADIAGPVNAIGNDINQAFELDIQNMFIGAVSLRQPVFMGGKIVAANKMAALAENLAESKYDISRTEVINEVDNAYWQTVSIANKKNLAKDYAALLEQMLHDTEILEEEGMATQADLLTVKVRANEAAMLLTKASNGLVLSKMLLCQLCGMDPRSEIELADEQSETLPLPSPVIHKTDEEIYAVRPEIRSLELAEEIYGRKVALARADMMPQVALTANYFVTNPNLYHGFRNSFSGMFNVGVAVNIPIIHGCEAMQKVRKAKAEQVIATCRLEEAKEKITLQVTQLRQQEEEAYERLGMAESNLDSAEENLRTATAGYREGVVAANTVLAAQTAWMKAHSEYIDAGVELRITAGRLANAEN